MLSTSYDITLNSQLLDTGLWLIIYGTIIYRFVLSLIPSEFQHS
jgi:hypothetical protein